MDGFKTNNNSQVKFAQKITYSAGIFGVVSNFHNNLLFGSVFTG
jgi:hypothetical protein